MQPPAPPPEHVPCPGCGRRFVADRLPIHRRACAGHGTLPGFRAAVHDLDQSDREAEIAAKVKATAEIRLSEEREQTAEQRCRADAAEARVAQLERDIANMLARAERAEAAAKSMEAAYDVMCEAVDDGKKREAALKARAEIAEAALGAIMCKLETVCNINLYI